MSRKAQQAQAEQQETTAEQDPLAIALAAHPKDRTPEQQLLIAQAGADVRLQSMVEDQQKLRERPE